MGNIISKKDENEVRALAGLIRAYYQTGVTHRFSHSQLRIEKMFFECNSEYKDVKEASMLRKSSINTLVQTKKVLENFEYDLSMYNKFNFKPEFVDLTEFSNSTKKLQNFIADDTDDQIEQTCKLREKLKERQEKLGMLRKKFEENKEKLKILHQKTWEKNHCRGISSGNSSVITNSSFETYNVNEEGDLTQRSLSRSILKLRHISNLDQSKSFLLSRLTLKSELSSTYALSSKTLNKKLKNARSTIESLESQLKDNPDPVLTLQILKNKIDLLESKLEIEKSEADLLKSSNSNLNTLHLKQLEILEKRVSVPLSFLV